MDTMFELLFARERRSPSGADVEGAWERAWYRLTGYIALGAISAVGFGALLFEWLTRISLPSGPPLLIGGGMMVAYMIVLRRRYWVYRTAPPVLRQTECPEETSFVFRFRAAVASGFILSLVLSGVYGFVIR